MAAKLIIFAVELHIASQYFDVPLTIWQRDYFVNSHANRAPLLPFISSCQCTSFSSSRHTAASCFALHRDHQSESAEQGHSGVILHVRILFIYLLSEDVLSMTLRLFRHVVLQSEMKKKYIWWVGDIVR